jgi:PilZ domain
MSEPFNKPVVIPAPVAEETGKASLPERRGGLRFPFTAAAEVFDVRSQTRLSGRCSDLSLGGCYIDTLSPFAVGSAVRVRIERDMHQFEAVANVSYAHVSMGMGLAFTEVKPEHQAILRSWLAELGGEQPRGPEVVTTRPQDELLAAIESVRQVLNELIHLLVRKRIMTENEAAGLLRQMFR